MVEKEWSEETLLLRSQLSSLNGLLVLSMLMADQREAAGIAELAAHGVTSIGECRLEGVRLRDDSWLAISDAYADPAVREHIAAQCTDPGADAHVTPSAAAWTWLYPLRSISGHVGHMVVAADTTPSMEDQFLLRVLAHQVGVATANATLMERDRRNIQALERKTEIHERLTRVALSGEGVEGVAHALHELTGAPVVIEDRYGIVVSSSGLSEGLVPDVTDGFRTRRDAAVRMQRPARHGARIVAAASVGHEVLGIISLLDPDGRAAADEIIALEHGATVLTTELSHLQALAETELRLSRDVVEELLLGRDDPDTLARARHIGFNPKSPHRVLMVREIDPKTPKNDADVHTVMREARTVGLEGLAVTRGSAVVLVTSSEDGWPALARALRSRTRRHFVVAVGTRATTPAALPESYRTARLTMRFVEATRTSAGGAWNYEDLDVYRLLADVREIDSIEAFTRKWIGELLDYDEHRGSELVHTLSCYLESGGSYDRAVATLGVGRSTLRYRMRRIKDLSGTDVTDPDTRFNLQLATRAWRTLLYLRAEQSVS